MDDFNFRKLLEEIQAAFEKRTADFHNGDKKYGFEQGIYNPQFSLLEREPGKLLCLWCGNKIKTKTKKQVAGKWKTETTTESEVFRLSESRLREGLTSEEWDAVGVAVCRHRGIK